MHARAYVLIEAEAGQVGSVIAALRGLQGVRTADVITGPYDLIAKVMVPTYDALGEAIPDKVHKMQGIRETETLIVFNVFK